MLYTLYASAVVLTFVSAQQNGGVGVGGCQSTLKAVQTTYVYNLVYDTDPDFVYDASQCTSANQKIVPSSGWALTDCTAAIRAVCGATTKAGGVAGCWTWGWHTTQGTTCQAGLHQAIDAGSSRGIGFLDQDCCEANFGAST